MRATQRPAATRLVSMLARLRQRLWYPLTALRVARGPRGWAQVVRTFVSARRATPATSPVAIPMRALAGADLLVRPGTSDLVNAAAYYEKGIQLPPPPVRERRLELICELGSNMGVGLSALGTEYPEARLLGAEPDPENCALAARNLARFGDRAQIANVAIWDRSTELVVDTTPATGTHGFVVRPREPGDPVDWASIEALSIDELLSRYAAGLEVDYMHVTIEGTEPRVFAAGGDWPRRVGSLRVEVHPYFDYRVADCVAQLEALGYRAWPAPDPPDKWVYAVRD